MAAMVVITAVEDARGVFGVTAKELGVRDMVVRGVFAGIFDSGGDNLRADELLRAARHGKTDGAGAAVEVKQRFRTCKPGVLCGLVVKRLRLRAVHLIKRVGRNFKLQPAERIANRGFAPQRAQLATQNDICALAVDV